MYWVSGPSRPININYEKNITPVVRASFSLPIKLNFLINGINYGPAVLCISEKYKKISLNDNDYEYLSLIGGLNDNQTSDIAVDRETMEEYGLSLSNYMNSVPNIYVEKDSKNHSCAIFSYLLPDNWDINFTYSPTQVPSETNNAQWVLLEDIFRIDPTHIQKHKKYKYYFTKGYDSYGNLKSIAINSLIHEIINKYFGKMMIEFIKTYSDIYSTEMLCNV